MPGFERQVVAGDDVGLLVHREPDAVTRAVHERIGKPLVCQHVAGHGVHLLCGHAGPHRFDRGLLGALQHRVPPRHLGIGLTDAVGAGGVGVVAGFVRASDVDDDDVAGPQFAVRTLVVRVRAVRARPDDDERDLRMPFCDNGFGDISGDVGFGAARHKELRHARMHPVDRRTGLAQCVDLGGVLDHSQPCAARRWPKRAPRRAHRPGAAGAARASRR